MKNHFLETLDVDCFQAVLSCNTFNARFFPYPREAVAEETHEPSLNKVKTTPPQFIHLVYYKSSMENFEIT